MRNCRYRFANGTEWMSYDGMMGYLRDAMGDSNSNVGRQLMDIVDVVFSKEGQAMKVQEDAIGRIRKEYSFSREGSGFNINGEPSCKEGMSVIDFLDTPSLSCLPNGDPLVTPFNREDYVRRQVERLQENGVPLRKAQEAVDAEVSHWDTIQRDAIDIHSMLLAPSVARYANNGGDYQAFRRETADMQVNGKFADSKVAQKFFDSAKKSIYGLRMQHRNSKLMSNVNFQATLQTMENRKILGHIDRLYIDDDGRLHVYLYKTSTTEYKDWLSVKTQKFKYQLAIIKAMLAANGINVKDAELNIIPVHVKYNDAHDRITGITVGAKQTLSSNMGSNTYAMNREDNRVRRFFTDTSRPMVVETEAMRRADNAVGEMFPNLNIVSEGISQSAQYMIGHARPSEGDGTHPLVIRALQDPEYHYEVIINGKSYKVKDKASPRKNKEIIELVQNNLRDINNNVGYVTSQLRTLIRDRYRTGKNNFTSSQFSGGNINLHAALGKYFTYNKSSDDSPMEYDWELMDTLDGSNVLLFRKIRGENRGQIDVVSLTPFQLTAKPKFEKGSSILGNFRYNVDEDTIDGDYGNVELMRVMLLLNEVYPQLAGTNTSLGTVTIISAVNDAQAFRQHNIGVLNRECFNHVVDVLGKERPRLNLVNNLNGARFVSLVDEVISQYRSITNANHNGYDFSMLGFEELCGAETQEARKSALFAILRNMFNSRAFRKYANPDQLVNDLRGRDTEARRNAELASMVMKAYQDVSGNRVSGIRRVGTGEGTFLPSFAQSNRNIKCVVNALQMTNDMISEEFYEQYTGSGFRNRFLEFYDKAGYSKARNEVIGNQAAMFRNMFDDSEEGRRVFMFKNPYDMSNNLTAPERELLKEVLYMIQYINHNGNPPVTRSGMKEFIEKDDSALWVPMTRASGATSAQTWEGIKAMFNTKMRRFRNALQRIDEMVNDVSEEERSGLGGDGDHLYGMHLQSKYYRTMPTSGRPNSDVAMERENAINRNGLGYYETNVENIMIDFFFNTIRTSHMSKFLVMANAFLVQMNMTGEFGGNQDAVRSEIEWLEKHIKQNVFKKSMMSETSQKIMAFVAPVKEATSHLLLGINLKQFVRDTMEGFQQNLMRTLIRYHSDISLNALTQATAYTTTHASHNGMAINFLQALSQKYKITQIDTEKIAERARSARNGILNFQNMMYGTMRSPDFHNRVTLFLAKLIDDGIVTLNDDMSISSKSALYLDSNGILKYDWRNDRRFAALAANRVHDKDYARQKAEYFSTISRYNLEHEDAGQHLDVSMATDLVDPYTVQQVTHVLATADNIFGAYGRAQKAMYEFQLLGLVFGQFTTWTNGILTNYFQKAQKNVLSPLEWVQRTDDQGRPLYYRDDGTITTDVTDLMVFDQVPQNIQGILATLGTLKDVLRADGIKAVKDYLEAHDHERANIRKAVSDLAMALFWFMLFKLFLSPAYKKYKTDEMPQHSFLSNACASLAYNSLLTSNDQYLGPLIVSQYINDDIEAPTLNVPAQLLLDCSKAALGTGTIDAILYNNFGPTRSLKTAIKVEEAKP